MKLELKWTVGPLDSRESPPDEQVPAHVPGGAQLDYANAHGWGDYNYGENARQYDGLEEKFWLYQTLLTLPLIKKEQKLFFVAKGIDYEFEVQLNGQSLFHQEGMFTPVEIELTKIAKTGDRLEVLIYPAPKRAGAKPHDREEADQCCKPAVSYGWDWHPYLVVLGIWDDCYLEVREPGGVDSCELFYTLTNDYSTVSLHFNATASGPVQYTLCDPEGRVVAESLQPDFTLEHPRLWWCNGQGEAALYTWTACPSEGGSEIWGRVGFRKVELAMNAECWDSVNGTRPFPPMTLMLNGRKIFAKGSNWVNPEIFPGTIRRETYEPLIRMGREAGFNLFRCWGGAIVNKESFFELCDEMGILIWQEFPLACNNYLGTPHYLAVLEQEARSIVCRLRQHACLALWCGGNELFCGWSRMTDQSLALRLLNKVCYELDPKTPYIPTSPIMGVSHGSYRFLYLDGRDVFEVSQSRHMTAYTEFGIPALPDPDYLRSFLPPDELFPPQPGGSYEFHHAFNAWGGREPWLSRDVLEYYFGTAGCIEELAAQSHWLQREGYKAFFEEARRQKPFCSMAINWCYNEPWKTAANNSLLAYPNIPKAGYSAVAESCRGMLASARIPKFLWYAGEELTLEPWLLNDSPQAYPNFTLHVFVELAGERIQLAEWRTGTICANENKCGTVARYCLPERETDKLVVSIVCQEDALLDSQYCLRYRFNAIKAETEVPD